MSTYVQDSQAPQAPGYSVTIIADFGGIKYYVNPEPVHIIHFQPSRPSDGFFSSLHQELHPCTVVDFSAGQHLVGNEMNIEHAFASLDDVWTSAFLEVVIFQRTRSSTISVRRDREPALFSIELTDLRSGPYAIRPSTGEIFRVLRLFEDDCRAFIEGSLARSARPGHFQWLLPGNRIAVPSRFGLSKSASHPLAMLRFAVKDIVDVAGLETGLGNRSYRKLYPCRTSSAPCIDQLLKAGAILVGKTKTTQFAEGQVPIQWTDYLAPFNPRGDRYQSPSASSTGSAVALAAYPWLDFTIGTDTGGSTRHPAGVCGTYGMRVSTSLVSTAGIYSVASLLDSLGVFARSAYILEAVIKVLMEPSQASSIPSKPPTKYKLLYPVRAKNTRTQDSYRWFPYPGQAGKAADVENRFEEIVQDLESHLKCTRTIFNMDDLWRQTHPTGQPETLDEATGAIYTILTTHTCVRETIDPFIADFQAANNTNRLPPIDPVVKARQNHGRFTTPSQHSRATKSAAAFSEWVRKVVFRKDHPDELPLLIFPQSWGIPSYRDELDTGPLFFSSFSIYSLSYLSGCPDCTVPVGEVLRTSRVTDAEMYLPVSLSVLSPPGTDAQLVGLLSKLENDGVLRAVQAGERMYGEADDNGLHQ